MFHRSRIRILVAATLVAAQSPALSEPSTPKGNISVAQVSEMLVRAPEQAAARQVLVAYTSGIGETAGVVADAGKLSCKRSFSLDVDLVRKALQALPAGADPRKTPATPILVGDMLRRADCQPRR